MLFEFYCFVSPMFPCFFLLTSFDTIVGKKVAEGKQFCGVIPLEVRKAADRNPYTAKKSVYSGSYASF